MSGVLGDSSSADETRFSYPVDHDDGDRSSRPRARQHVERHRPDVFFVGVVDSDLCRSSCGAPQPFWLEVLRARDDCQLLSRTPQTLDVLGPRCGQARSCNDSPNLGRGKCHDLDLQGGRWSGCRGRPRKSDRPIALISLRQELLRLEHGSRLVCRRSNGCGGTWFDRDGPSLGAERRNCRSAHERASLPRGRESFQRRESLRSRSISNDSDRLEVALWRCVSLHAAEGGCRRQRAGVRGYTQIFTTMQW